MGRSPCCDKNGLKKGPWTTEEDNKLTQYIQAHGPGNWRTLPKNAGLERCGKSCRLRWTNYLRPDIKRGRFSFEEEETIIQLHSVLGNKWSAIAARLPGRTDNEIKNYWNTHIRKRLLRTGIDPVTHAPRVDMSDLSSLLGSTQLSLMSLLGLQQTLLNPEALRLAMNLVSHNENQFMLNNINQAVHPAPLAQPNPFDNNIINIDQQIPPFHQSHVGPTEASGQVFHDSLNANDCGIMNLDRNLMAGAELSDNNSSFQSLNASSSLNCSFDSVLSTDPLNSGLVTEDERDSFCSELFRFEIPEGLNFDEFM